MSRDLGKQTRETLERIKYEIKGKRVIIITIKQQGAGEWSYDTSLHVSHYKTMSCSDGELQI